LRVLLTGSSGWLGRFLAPRLRAKGHAPTGLDVAPGADTDVIGSVADRALVDRLFAERGIETVIHAGALHKPDIVRYPPAAFREVNVAGTRNLLEAAAAAGNDRFVFTSTTSLMISQEIRDAHKRGIDRAFWIDEEMTTLEPRNIYGVSKLSAEHLCRMVHGATGLPIIILRTSRFFPEEDDMAQEIIQSGPNTKANEFLFRRLTVHDAASAHIVALDRAPQIGFDTFIISALTPFSPEDCEQLMDYAPLVVHRYFPRYREIYARRGWTMFDYIDRVYDSNRAMRRLGFVCRTDFGDILAQLDREDGV
jgi:UDP-glucose 4-epimerase